VALTRLFALSTSLWDWDEALFCSALREYDVVHYRPHPPGYPLFIALGQVTRLLFDSDFRALQALNVLGSMALFPLVYLLARELRFAFRTSYLGALLFAFFPNVWFYGGTAYSEIISLAVALAAMILLLRGRLSGAFVLALAAAIRPQIALIGIIPFWKAASRPPLSYRRFTAFISLFAAVTLAAYVSAAFFSESVSGYLDVLRHQGNYFRTVDSFMNPERESLGVLADRFLFEAMPGAGRAAAVAVFAVIALVAAAVRRQWSVFQLAAIFLPHALAAWLMFDQLAVARYTLPHVTMHAVLAAEGIGVVAALFGRFAARLQTLLVAALIALFVIWTAPGLRVVATSDAPPVAAMKLIRRAVPADETIYAFHSLSPFTHYYLADRRVVHVRAASEAPPDAVYVAEGRLSGGDVRTFERERNPLTRIARRRYFTVSVRMRATTAAASEATRSRSSGGSITSARGPSPRTM
jgi:hypothetical protein